MTDPDTPPITSLESWQVGNTPERGMEVRFELTDKDEARAWVAWFLSKRTDNAT